jgi:hypothetical protein
LKQGRHLSRIARRNRHRGGARAKPLRNREQPEHWRTLHRRGSRLHEWWRPLEGGSRGPQERRPDPTVSHVMAMAEVFGVDPPYLVGHKEMPFLDRETIEALRHETVRQIARASSSLPEMEKRILLGSGGDSSGRSRSRRRGKDCQNLARWPDRSNFKVGQHLPRDG